MVDLPVIQELYRYNRWANDRMLEAVSILTQAEFTKDFASSHPSRYAIRSRTSSGPNGFGCSGGRERRPGGLRRRKIFSTWAHLRGRWLEVEIQQRAFIETMTTEALLGLVQYVNLQGQTWQYPALATDVPCREPLELSPGSADDDAATAGGADSSDGFSLLHTLVFFLSQNYFIFFNTPLKNVGGEKYSQKACAGVFDPVKAEAFAGRLLGAEQRRPVLDGLDGPPHGSVRRDEHVAAGHLGRDRGSGRAQRALRPRVARGDGHGRGRRRRSDDAALFAAAEHAAFLTRGGRRQHGGVRAVQSRSWAVSRTTSSSASKGGGVPYAEVPALPRGDGRGQRPVGAVIARVAHPAARAGSDGSARERHPRARRGMRPGPDPDRLAELYPRSRFVGMDLSAGGDRLRARRGRRRAARTSSSSPSI